MIKKERKNNGQQKPDEQGFILVVGIIIMAFLLLLALPFLYQLSAENRLTDKSFKSSVALALAEAGVERAVWEMNYGDISSWSGDSTLRIMTISDFQTPEGQVIGDIEIKVIDPEGECPVIESRGKVAYSGSVLMAKTTIVRLKEEPYPPWTHGIFGDEDLDFSSAAEVDSYDSRNGPYGGSNVGSDGDVGTNGTQYGCIDLCSNAKIYGDAFSGPETDPESVIITRVNSLISGEKQALEEEKLMPSVIPPDDLLPYGNYLAVSGSTETIDQSGFFSSFVIESNSTVTITADIILLVTGDFSMLSNTRFEIANGASLTLYLAGTFNQASNSQFNNLTEDPTKLLILGTDSFNGTMVWNSNTDFWGAVYVPRAHVDFRSNIDFYGSIISRSFEFNSNARIHYDMALADLRRDDMDGLPYVIKSWQEQLSPVFVDE